MLPASHEHVLDLVDGLIGRDTTSISRSFAIRTKAQPGWNPCTDYDKPLEATVLLSSS